MKELKKQLTKLCEDFDASATVVVKDLQTNENIQINSDKPFYVASIIKMWLLWLFFIEEQEGKRNLEEKVKLNCDLSLINMGICDLVHSDIEWTYKDLLYMMVVLSDNHCTNHIIDVLTLEKVNAEIKRLGAKDTVFNRKMNAGTANLATGDAVASIFELFFTSPQLSEKNRTLALDMLSKQRYNTKLPLNFKSKMLSDGNGNIFYHKTGEIPLAEVDAGVLSMPKQNKNVVIVCMTQDLKNNRAGIVFNNKVGELVYDYFN